MKTIKLLMILILMSAFTVSINARHQDKIDPQLMKEFEKSVEQWKQAYNSGNAQNLVPLYSENAVYTSSHVNGLEAKGRDKLIANFQNGVTMGGHIDEIEILSVNVSCDLATLYCKYQATNAGITATGRNLLVIKKSGNAWLIVMHMTVV